MHPPLFKPHPLCEREVEELVACHARHPVLKFVNACGAAKVAMDACFREEKKLRVALNKRIPDPLETAAAAAALAAGAKRD
jgi:hypothetical protein